MEVPNDLECSQTEVKSFQVKLTTEPLKCPRCDSTNTKFCYYNNYNKSQPRHYCKSCKRYWTKGGALRSVPIGGGGRKLNRHQLKKTSSSSVSCNRYDYAADETNNVEKPSKRSIGLLGANTIELDQLNACEHEQSPWINLDCSMEGSNITTMYHNNIPRGSSVNMDYWNWIDQIDCIVDSSDVCVMGLQYYW